MHVSGSVPVTFHALQEQLWSPHRGVCVAVQCGPGVWLRQPRMSSRADSSGRHLIRWAFTSSHRAAFMLHHITGAISLQVKCCTSFQKHVVAQSCLIAGDRALSMLPPSNSGQPSAQVCMLVKGFSHGCQLHQALEGWHASRSALQPYMFFKALGEGRTCGE